MKEKQLHGEELTKEDLKRAVKDEAYRKKLLEELNAFSQNLSTVMKNMQKRVRNLWITAKNQT